MTDSAHQVLVFRPQLGVGLVALPTEIIQHIATLLPVLSDVNNLGRTCRRIFRSLNYFLYQLDASDTRRYALPWAATHGMERTAQHALDAGTPADTCRNRVVDPYIRKRRTQRRGVRCYRLRNPLEIAVDCGQLSIVRLLLDAHADTTRISDQGETMVLKAATRGDSAILRILLDHDRTHINTPSSDGRTPLSEAVQHGHAQAVYVLLSSEDIDIDYTPSSSRPPFLLAARHGWENILLTLLDSGVRVEIQFSDISYLCQSQTHSTAACIEALLPYCASNRWTPNQRARLLHNACFAGNLPVVKLLLKHGASIGVDASYAVSGLERAREYGNDEVVRFLLELREQLSVLQRAAVYRAIREAR